MTDILIRNMDEDDIARIDERAGRLGLSRTEYIRRALHQEARPTDRSVTSADWDRFAAATSDLHDDEIMRGAWS